jgi:hypothetical protein
VDNGLVGGCLTNFCWATTPCYGVSDVFINVRIRSSKMTKEEFVTAYVLARANALSSMDSARVVEAAFRAWDLVEEKLNYTTRSYS